MAESLYEVLEPHFGSSAIAPASTRDSQATTNYLNRLYTLSVDAVNSTEPGSLEHEAQTTLRSLQALSKRSYRSIDSAGASLQHLQTNLPSITASAQELRATVPSVESASSSFAAKYAKPAENAVLDRRRRALRLGENADRLSDILELPTLLASIISAAAAVTQSAAQGTGSASSVPSAASANASYASALDLFGHIKRLQRLYPTSELIKSISLQAEAAMRDMVTNLISALRSSSLKLAGGMRLIGLLRRIAPELDDGDAAAASVMSSRRGQNISTQSVAAGTASEGSLGALFLVCRLANLSSMLDALEPLRELADQETATRLSKAGQAEGPNTWAAGQQTERYLKRYIEVFREQCFAMVSMYKSIFPASLSGPASANEADSKVAEVQQAAQSRQDIPPALATFTAHIVDVLCGTLRKLLPNVRDQGSRDSLLTQVLYCAGSLGRLGGDFGMMLALLEEDMADEEAGTQDATPPEWVHAMKKHRVQAGRLELLASGASPRADVLSPK